MASLAFGSEREKLSCDWGKEIRDFLNGKGITLNPTWAGLFENLRAGGGDRGKYL